MAERPKLTLNKIRQGIKAADEASRRAREQGDSDENTERVSAEEEIANLRHELAKKHGAEAEALQQQISDAEKRLSAIEPESEETHQLPVDVGEPTREQEQILAQVQSQQESGILGKLRKMYGARQTSSSGAQVSAAQPHEPAEVPRELERAARAIESGKGLWESLKSIVGQKNKETVSQIESKVEELARTTASATPEEQDAIRQIATDPSAHVQQTPAVIKAANILDAIAIASKGVKLPPKMRGYSKIMTARPVGEVITIGLEAGIFSLIGTSVLNAVGIPVAPYSALHAVTYAVSAGGLGALNLTTKSSRILGSVAEGSTHPLIKNPNTGKFSVTRTASSFIRLAILPVSIMAGIAVAQQAVSTTDQSSRVAGGIADPLEAFARKRNKMVTELPQFAKIPDKILEIARKIERGKPKIQGAREKKDHAPWSVSERKQMTDELRTLFRNAGLDPEMVSSITFRDPKDLGHGRASKFKEALQTGDTSDLAELGAEEKTALNRIVGPQPSTAAYVAAIRQKMGLAERGGLEQKMLEVIRVFLADSVLIEVSKNLVQAQRIEGIIRSQGEDAVQTFERAFLHGAAPVSAEAVMPYAQAIIDAREKIAALSKEKLEKPIGEIFKIEQDALGAVGATVTLTAPAAELDTSDMVRLSEFITSIAKRKAEQAATEAVTHDALSKLYKTFVFGGQKYEDTNRYIAMTQLRRSGYIVRVRGAETLIYEAINPEAIAQEKRESSKSPGLFERINMTIEEWKKKLFTSEQEQYDWKNVDITDLLNLSDEELAARVLPQLDRLATLVVQTKISGEIRKHKEPEQWSPTMEAAKYQALLDLSAPDLGRLVREQMRVQIRFGNRPFIWGIDEWNAIKRGELPPQDTRQSTEDRAVDPSKWRELGKEEAQKLLASYESWAAARGVVYMAGGMGALVLGVLLLSLYPVYRVNKRLRDSGPQFEKELVEAEKSIVEALAAVNDIFSGIPVLNSLPPMDFTTFHAALRLAGEEVFPTELSEEPSTGSRAMHVLTETLSRGPYAHSVKEIMSFMRLVEKMRSSKRMQNRVANILAPGSARAESIARRTPIPAVQTSSKIENIQEQLTAIPGGVTREVFRDSARGNLRFRLAVIDAELQALSGIEREGNASYSSAIASERSRLTAEASTFNEILRKLDKDAHFERATTAYKPPRALSQRASERDRADTSFRITIPRDLMANKRFSAPRGIIDDVRARIESMAAQT